MAQLSGMFSLGRSSSNKPGSEGGRGQVPVRWEISRLGPAGSLWEAQRDSQGTGGRKESEGKVDRKVQTQEDTV